MVDSAARFECSIEQLKVGLVVGNVRLYKSYVLFGGSSCSGGKFLL